MKQWFIMWTLLQCQLTVMGAFAVFCLAPLPRAYSAVWTCPYGLMRMCPTPLTARIRNPGESSPLSI